MPCVFRYGMWHFGVLAGLLIFGGLGMALYLQSSYILGGWFTGVVLLLFAFIARSVVLAEAKRAIDQTSRSDKLDD